MLAVTFWGAASLGTVVLAFNRVLGLVHARSGRVLFDGKWAWLWTAATAAYGLYYGLFNTPPLYSAVTGAWQKELLS